MGSSGSSGRIDVEGDIVDRAALSRQDFQSAYASHESGWVHVLYYTGHLSIAGHSNRYEIVEDSRKKDHMLVSRAEIE